MWHCSGQVGPWEPYLSSKEVEEDALELSEHRVGLKLLSNERKAWLGSNLQTRRKQTSHRVRAR